jgi:putative redox protein
MNSATATARPGKPYQLEITARGHKAVSDVPLSLGGSDSGMTPHEMFLGGIAGCIVDTLWMHAVLKKWDLQEISVTITETQIDDPNAPGTKIPLLTEQIEVKGNLTAASVQRLAALAPKCPVHKLFTGPKQVATAITHVAPPAMPSQPSGGSGQQP